MVAKQKLIDVPEAGAAVKAFEWFGQSFKYSYCKNPRKFAPQDDSEILFCAFRIVVKRAEPVVRLLALGDLGFISDPKFTHLFKRNCIPAVRDAECIWMHGVDLAILQGRWTASKWRDKVGFFRIDSLEGSQYKPIGKDDCFWWDMMAI